MLGTNHAHASMASMTRLQQLEHKDGNSTVMGCTAPAPRTGCGHAPTPGEPGRWASKRSTTCKGKSSAQHSEASRGRPACCLHSVKCHWKQFRRQKYSFSPMPAPLAFATSLQDQAVRWAGAQPHLQKAHLALCPDQQAV